MDKNVKYLSNMEWIRTRNMDNFELAQLHCEECGGKGRSIEIYRPE